MAQPSCKDSARRRTLISIGRAFFPSLPELAKQSLRQHEETVAEYFDRSADDFPEAFYQAWRQINVNIPTDKRNELFGFLDLLATRLGTLLLCGYHALTWRFPFVVAYHELSDTAREAVLLAWSKSWLLPLRVAFNIFRSLLLATLFGCVDETGVNPLWGALKYPGPSVYRPHTVQPAALEAEAKLKDAVFDLEQLAGENLCSTEVVERLQRTGLSAAVADEEVGRLGCGVCVEVDMVVVGSGAGGGVVAALAAESGLRVLVIEKGSFVTADDMTHLEVDSLGRMFERGGGVMSEDASLLVLAGATLGGGTRINWCASFRTPPHVRREWAEQHGLQNFVSDRYDRALDSVCGRMKVNTEVIHDGQNSVLLSGMRALEGHVEVVPRNCTSPVCSGLCTMGCKSGHKQDSVNTFLSDAAGAGARVFTAAYAQRIVVQEEDGDDSNNMQDIAASAQYRRRKRARGVVVHSTSQTGGQQLKLLVKARYVVSSCGSLHSPALLLRSGITCDGNVGRHLHTHPSTILFGVFPSVPLAPGCRAGPVKLWEGSMMSAYSTQVGKWEGSGYGALLFVPQLVTNLCAAFTPWRGAAAYKAQMLEYENTAALLVITRDSGEGQVYCDQEGRPRIKYTLAARDGAAMEQGMELAARVLAAGGAHTIFSLHHQEDVRCTLNGPDDPAIEPFIAKLRQLGARPNRITLGSAHQMGTCRMGEHPGRSVVDGEGECWEVAGLYVADASAFPTASGVNPMITTAAIAHMVGEGIVEREGRRRRKGARRVVSVAYDE